MMSRSIYNLSVAIKRSRFFVVALFAMVSVAVINKHASAQLKPSEVVSIWPALAPGETSDETGEALPNRPNEKPPVTRVVKIRKPTLEVFPAEDPNGVGSVSYTHLTLPTICSV